MTAWRNSTSSPTRWTVSTRSCWAGVDPAFCATRRESLRKIGDDLGFWERIYRKRHGSAPVPVTADDEAEDDIYEDDELEDEVEADDHDEVTN